jgi:hypothetical protein
VADVDGDGVPDFIAIMDTPSRGPSLEAVSGRSGKLLWRYPLAVPLDDPWKVVGFNPHREWQPEVVRVKGRSLVVLIVGGKLFGVDLKTGKSAWPPHELGFAPPRPPVVADLDGDGEPELLLLRWDEKMKRYGTMDRDGEMNLLALSLRTRAPLWEKALDDPISELPLTPGYQWPLVADLDGDGKLEVIVPIRRREDKQGAWAGVAVLEGATGEPRWQRCLAPSRVTHAWTGAWMLEGAFPQNVQAFLVGPDLDGDGRKELFTAFFWLDDDGKETKGWLVTEALSGHDGHSLWVSRQRVSSLDSHAVSVGRLRWWQPANDGWPQLVVPCRFDRKRTFVFATGSGRLAHILEGVADVGERDLSGASDVGVADLNGDGLPDLYFVTRGRGQTMHLHGLRGTPPDTWRWLHGNAAWRPTRDRNGDGLVDWAREKVGRGSDVGPGGEMTPHYRGPSDTVLLSGRTGRVLSLRDRDSEVADEDRGRDQLLGSQVIGARTAQPFGKWLESGEGPLVVWPPTGLARLRMQIDFGGGQPGLKVLQAGTTLFGVDSSSGRPRWRCDTREGEGFNRVPPPLTLLVDDTGRSLPRVVFACGWAVLAREALPSGPDGRYLPPPGQPREYGELPEDPRWVRPLLWTHPSQMPGWRMALLPYGALVALVGYGLVRRKWRLLCLILANFTLVTVFYWAACWYGGLVPPLLPMQRYSSRGWYQIGLYGAFFIGWSALGLLVVSPVLWLRGRKPGWL